MKLFGRKISSVFRVKSKSTMGWGGRAVYSGLLVLAVIVLLRFLNWWFDPSHIPTNWINTPFHLFDYLLFAILSFVVFFELFLRVGNWITVWFMRKPEHVEPEPGLKVAFVTCYVPGKEPLKMLEKTLVAMRYTEYPHDTWVLDEGNDDEVRQLCKNLGVKHFSRNGIALYNQSSGIYRAKTKAGNLNSWRNEFENLYDIVAQLDMDHVPKKDYLLKTLGYFRDPTVGFVGVPQIYKNTKNWIARGASEQTHFFYGPLQQGFYGAHMPSLTGTTHIYRVKAMQEFGGYAPTIAEDYLTGLHFFSKGWNGVYVPEIVAAGDGPTTWGDYFSQQMRWSYGLFEILFTHSKNHFFRLSVLQKVNIFFSQLFYFSGFVFFFGALLTTLYFFFGYYPANMEISSWLFYALPAYGISQLIMMFLHRYYIDPKNEPHIGLFGMLLSQASSVIYVIAFLRFITRRKMVYKVTPKGIGAETKIQTHMFRPHFYIFLATATGMIASFLIGNDSVVMRFWGAYTLIVLSVIIFSSRIEELINKVKTRNIQKSLLEIKFSQLKLAEIGTNSHEKYRYIINNPWSVRGIYLLGMATWLGVVYGYTRLADVHPLYLFIFVPIIGYFTVYYFISYFINLFYRKFDVIKHNEYVKTYWNGVGKKPTVDVFLPVCGEKIEVLARTFQAVGNLDYQSKQVYVLDDKGDYMVKDLAVKHNFIYLSRPNKGYMKKAGNLLFGFESSHGDYITVFDADFAPTHDFITELLPYMSDRRTAIVQSPQYFQVDDEVHDRSPLEYGAGHVQEDFYRIIQVARDNFNAAICVGSNAIYRRSALAKIGGTAQIEHSEDVHTGFNLMQIGYRVKYVPLILAKGLCPDDITSYFYQQYRWCSGSLSLMTSKKFWNSNLSLIQRLCFIAGFMYYISFVFELLLPFQVFIMLFFHSEYISLTNALVYLPALFFSLMVLPAFRVGRMRVGTVLARTTYKYSYVYAIFSKLLSRNLGWKPTNSKRKSFSAEFTFLMKANAIYLLVYLALASLAYATIPNFLTDINYFSILFWILYNLYTYTIFLYYSYKTLDIWNKRTMELRKRYYAWRVSTAGSYASIAILLIILPALMVGSNQTEKAKSQAATEILSPLAQVTHESIIQGASRTEEKSYTFLVKNGDSYARIASKALELYQSEEGVTLSSRQKNYIQYVLSESKNTKPLIPGDTVSFKSGEIKSAISTALVL